MAFQRAASQDIETSVAPLVGPVQLYKVNHHCSAYSTNDTWLKMTKPQVGIVSVGDGNTYGHPTTECLERLHQADVKTYWTEKGNGADPEPGLDIIGGTAVVEVAAGAKSFTVKPTNGVTDKFTFDNSQPPPPNEPKFVWSKHSNVYHYGNCQYAQAISPENLMKGDSPPPGKTLHKGCPK